MDGRFKSSTSPKTSALHYIMYIVSLCCLIRNTTNNFLCDKCGKFFNDPCIHATTSCDYLSNIRDKFWTEIISLDPITFSAFLGCKSDDELCFILLSCDTDFELDNDNMARFQLLYVTYVYRWHHVVMDLTANEPESLIILEYWINSQLLDYLSFFSFLINCICFNCNIVIWYIVCTTLLS